jgi:hypothetical protein
MRVPLVLVLVALAGCDKPTVPPGEAIDVAIMPASYHDNSDAPGEVKTKCKFHQKIAEEVVEAAPGSQLSTHNSGKILTMEVVTMHGVDPASAGDRTVILTGEFTEGGVRTGNFHMRRSAPSGVFGGMPGVCASLDEIAETMAYDIARWLRDPEENSELEEAE